MLNSRCSQLYRTLLLFPSFYRTFCPRSSSTHTPFEEQCPFCMGSRPRPSIQYSDFPPNLLANCWALRRFRPPEVATELAPYWPNQLQAGQEGVIVYAMCCPGRSAIIHLQSASVSPLYGPLQNFHPICMADLLQSSPITTFCSGLPT